MLLQQGDEEVHGQMHVLDQLVLGHANMADSNRKAQNLLHLELDGGLKVLHLLLKVVTVSHQGGKLSSLVQTGSQKPGDLLDQSVRSKESIKLLGKLLNLLLVLVQLLEVISGHAVHAQSVGLVTMLLVSEEADLVLLARDMLQPAA